MFGVDRIDDLNRALTQAIDGQKVKDPQYARFNESKGKVDKILNEASIYLAEAISEEGLLRDDHLSDALKRIKEPTEKLLQKYKSHKDTYAKILQFREFVDGIDKLKGDSRGIESSEDKISAKTQQILLEDINQLSRTNPTLAKRLVKSLSQTHQLEIKELWKQSKSQRAFEKMESLHSAKISDSKVHAAFAEEMARTDLRTQEGRMHLLDQLSKLGASHGNKTFELIERLLINSGNLPQTLADGTKAKILKQFVQDARELNEINPKFAYDFIKKLNKELANPCFKLIFESSNNNLKLGVEPIHINNLLAAACFRTGFEKIECGKIIGDKSEIDLTGYNPKLTADILSKIGPDVRKLIVSPNFGITSPLKNVEILEVKSQGKVDVNLEQLNNLLSAVPNVKNLILPPIFVRDADHVHVFALETWRIYEYLHELERLGATYEDRVMHAIYHAAARGGTHPLFFSRLNDSKTLSPTFIGLTHLLVSPSRLIGQSFWLRGRVDHSKYDNVKGQDLCRLMIASNLLQNFELHHKEWIDFSNNPTLTHEQLLGFLQHQDGRTGASNAQKVAVLSLENCQNFSNESINYLLKNGKKLRKLSLKGCVQVDDQAFANLPKDSLKKLDKLELRGTSVSYAMVEKLRKEYPYLKIFWNEKQIAAGMM